MEVLLFSQIVPLFISLSLYNLRELERAICIELLERCHFLLPPVFPYQPSGGLIISAFISASQQMQTKEQLFPEWPNGEVTILPLFNRISSQGSAKPDFPRSRIKTPQPREQNGRPAGFPHRAETRCGKLRKGAPVPH